MKDLVLVKVLLLNWKRILIYIILTASNFSDRPKGRLSEGASARMRRGNGPSSCQDTRDTHPCLAGSSDPQFLNENYNHHSNAKCQCQGRFDAKRDSPGSF